MNKYFFHENNLEDPWFTFDVNESNVFDYVSDSKNKFPLTPTQIVDMWSAMNSFKKDGSLKEKNNSSNSLI